MKNLLFLSSDNSYRCLIITLHEKNLKLAIAERRVLHVFDFKHMTSRCIS